MSDWSREFESELLRKISEGDREALAMVYDRFSKPLFSLAFKILTDRRDAEEVVQDVFLSLWRQAGTFDSSRAKAFTWMTAMTRNRSIDRLRARSSRIINAENFLPETATTAEKKDLDDASDNLIRKERQSSLENAMTDLPVEQKEVLELAFLSGWTHAEIAKEHELSLGTVKARIRYGLIKLRNRIKPS